LDDKPLKLILHDRTLRKNFSRLCPAGLQL
jgi:hypothetical protein